ncbi:MAG: hypothetical protein RLZZ528_190 [Pseudomonadota bacterium]|jgi:hypothetical protein
MKWSDVQENWAAFYEAILDKWPDADEAELDEIEGEQRAFVTYIAELTGQEPGDARDEIKEWLADELPSDLLLDAGIAEEEDEDGFDEEEDI